MQLTSAAIQVLPMNADNKEVVRIVDEAIAYIKSYNLNTTVGPFETTVEGDYDTIMKMISEVTRICLKAGADEIMTYVKICAKAQGSVMTIDEKTKKHN
ncbi:MAG: thiamine-binding protein [Clostridia bacterium]|nr:thiamine-binding protein [Clostridia bacterium]